MGGNMYNKSRFSIKIVSASILLIISIHSAIAQRTIDEAIEQANTEIWNKFVDHYGIIRDFVGETPTPEDCLKGHPNAIGWWSPIENGPFFTGLYLSAACERAKRSGTEVDKNKARKLANGLLKCASVSDVNGFIVRGIGTDGKCHYPLGSVDQTIPWYLGLFAYSKSEIPSATEKAVVINKLKEVTNALMKEQWKLPCDGKFKGQYRGDLKEKNYLEVTSYLFVLRMMYELTDEEIWLRRYKDAIFEHPVNSEKNRAEICAFGYRIDSTVINTDKSLWIYVKNQQTLAYIHSMETDPRIRKYYATGLIINAQNALSVIDEYKFFNNSDTKIFGHANWRKGYPNWVPQKTQHEAEEVANNGDFKILGKRKEYERNYMTNPLAAAAIISFAGDSLINENRILLETVINHYDYSKLNLSEFFFAEISYYGLPQNKVSKYNIAAYIWPSCHDDPMGREILWPEGTGEWEIIKKGNPRFEGHYQPKIPLWGYELDNDPNVMEKWIEAATDHGINTFIFDWYWFNNGPFLESSLNDGFLKARNNKEMNFYIMWADHDVVYNYWNAHRYKDNDSRLWSGAIDWENFKIVVDRVINQYFKKPNYFKIEGKPVFSIFSIENLIKTFGTIGETQKGLEYFRKEVRKAGFPDLHIQLIAEGIPNEERLQQIYSLGINSLTSYNWGEPRHQDYIQWGTESQDRLDKWDNASQLPYFPNVSVGWDDTPRFPQKDKEHVTHLNQSPQSFSAFLQKAKEYCDRHPEQPKLITIYAWNEWIEGAYLLPDMKYGFDYLNAVKDVIIDGKYDQYRK